MVSDVHAGKKIPCPDCGVPSPVGAAAEAEAVLDPFPQPPAPAQVVCFTCKECGTELTLPDSYLGREVACPECDVRSVVGAAAEPERPDAASGGPALRAEVLFFTCRACGSEMTIPDSYEGRPITCPECDTV